MEQECQSDNQTIRKQTDKQAQVKNYSKANKEQQQNKPQRRVHRSHLLFDFIKDRA